MDKKKAKKTWMWVVPLAGLMAAAVPLRENYFELSKQLEIMTAMFRELNIYYVDEIQPGQLMETGMDAMVESLDPYTVYYPESRVEDLRFMTTGEYGGIGASMQFINGMSSPSCQIDNSPSAATPWSCQHPFGVRT